MKVGLWLLPGVLFCAAVMATGCGGGSSEKKAGVEEVQQLAVTLTPDGCTPATINARTGPTKITVTNKGANGVSELEVLDGKRVLGEVENVHPGDTRSFTIVLRPGTFEMLCPGGSKTESGKLAASGKAPAEPTPVPGPQTDVKVALADFTIGPGPASAPAGTLNFDVRNAGPTAHELVVIRTALAATELPVKDGTVDEEDKRMQHIDEVEDLEKDSRVTFSVGLTPGHYVLVCNIKDHYTQGMRADFVVSN